MPKPCYDRGLLTDSVAAVMGMIEEGVTVDMAMVAVIVGASAEEAASGIGRGVVAGMTARATAAAAVIAIATAAGTSAEAAG
jgi:hypothetical protein